MAAFRGMHVLPAKYSYAWLPRKCDYWTERRTDGQTDRQTANKVIPMCCYALQATQWLRGKLQHFTWLHLEGPAMEILQAVCRQASITDFTIHWHGYFHNISNFDIKFWHWQCYASKWKIMSLHLYIIIYFFRIFQILTLTLIGV